MTRHLLTAVAVLALAGPAAAQPFDWTGNGGNANWSNPANWTTTAPTSNPNNDIRFGLGTAQLSPSQDIVTGFQLNTLQFINGAAPYTIGGLALDFRSTTAGGAAPQILNGSGIPQVVNNDLILSNPLSVASGGSTTTLGGTLSGPGGLSMTSNGLTVLAGAGTYAGTTSVFENNDFRVNGTLDNSGGTVTVSNGRTLDGTGAINRPVSLTGFAQIGSAGTLTLGATLDVAATPGNLIAGTVNVAGLTGITGNFQTAAGTTLGGVGDIDIANGAQMNVAGLVGPDKDVKMTFTTILPLIQGSGTIGGAITANAGQVTATGNSVLTLNGPVTSTGAGTTEFTFGNLNGNSITHNDRFTVAGGVARMVGVHNGAGGVQVDAAGQLLVADVTAGAGKAFAVAGTLRNVGTSTINGPVTLNSGLLRNDPGGTLNLAGTLTTTGAASISGTVAVAGTTTIGAEMLTLQAGASLTGAGGLTVQAMLSGEGSSTVSKPVVLQGGTVRTTGVLAVNNSLTQQSGLSTLAAGALSVAGPTLVQGGEFQILLPALLTGNGAVSVQAGGKLTNFGAVQKVVTAAGTAGSLAVVGGTGTFAADVTIGQFAVVQPGTSPGTITIGGGLTLDGDYDWDLNGNDNTMAGGTFDKINAAGLVALGASSMVNAKLSGLALDFSDAAFWGSPKTWKILETPVGFADGTLPGLTVDTTGAANDFTTFYPGGSFSLTLDPDPGLLVVWNPTPVPEPGTLGLVGVGLVGGWLARRRSRRA